MDKKIIFALSIFIMFLSISVVSANENATDVGINNDELLSDIEEPYNSEIIVNEYNSYYNSMNPLTVKVKTNTDEKSNIPIQIKNNAGKIVYSDYTDDDGVCLFNIYETAGKYKFTVDLGKSASYKAKSVVINLNIKKAPVKLTANKVISDTKSYTALKATVKDNDGCTIDEGTVKFTINGKSYKVKVDSGVAYKKIKLTKDKTYTYKAVFSSKNYNSKSVSSKAVVKKAKSYYIFKAGKYSCKLSYSQYKKLINAKLNGKDSTVKIKIGSYPYKAPNYKTVKVKKTKWVYKKVLSYKVVSNYDWSDTTHYDYSLNKYYNQGWEWYGSKTVESDDGRVLKTYAKLKKKVTYTETKKVKSGFKTAYSPIYFYVVTYAHDGLIPKGDYLRVWTLADYDMGKYLASKKVNLNNY